MTLFAQAYKGKLSAIFGYVPRYQRRITLSSSNEEIIQILRTDMKNGVQKTAGILMARAKNMGESATVVVRGDSTHIAVQITDVFDTTRARHAILSSGRLEFWDTYENEEMIQYLIQADKALALILKNTPVAKPIEKKAKEKDFFADAVITTDTAGNSKKIPVQSPAAAADPETNKNPLFTVLAPRATETQLLKGPSIGLARGKDTATVNRYLGMTAVRACFPKDVKFLWSANPVDRTKDVYELYAIKVNLGSPGAPVTGDMISKVAAGVDDAKMPEVSMHFNTAGAHRWEMMTAAAANGTINGLSAHRSIAIVVDDRVISAPIVQSAITGGNMVITGIGDKVQTYDMEDIFRSGMLPAPVRLMDEHIGLSAKAKE
jgi:SecD/SecF fusion protein